jgi:hypothetical protein
MKFGWQSSNSFCGVLRAFVTNWRSTVGDMASIMLLRLLQLHAIQFVCWPININGH